jgi:hypothetical protein
MRISILCLTALFLTPAGVTAQDEAALRAAFEGRMVAPRLDMPATTGGVNVFPYRRPPLDQGDLARDVARYGIGVPSGRAAQVTRIKVKGKHIEFQLGRGGKRQEPSRSHSYVPKSREEQRLEDEIKKTTDRGQKKRLEDQLRDLRDQRYREEERIKALERVERDLKVAQHTPEEWALMAGARFNVRFDSKVPAEALTPEGLEALMARWVDFAPAPKTDVGTTTAGAPGGLRKGMPQTEVERDLGPPAACEESDAGGLLILVCRWSLPEGHLQAHFVDQVLVKYTLSSDPP